MDTMTYWLSNINDVLWSYILIAMLLGCALWFTIKTKFVQFRMIGEMIKVLSVSLPRLLLCLKRPTASSTAVTPGKKGSSFNAG